MLFDDLACPMSLNEHERDDEAFKGCFVVHFVTH